MAESLDVASVSGAPFGVSARHASGLTLEPVEAAVVAAIRRAGPLSRTDLAERLDYSRASLTAIVGRMIAAGVLSEVGEGKSAGGRRPYLLDINPGLGYVVGVDIGATSVDVALADFRGSVLERAAEPADVRANPDEFLGRVAELIADTCAAAELTQPKWWPSASACPARWSSPPACSSLHRSCPCGKGSPFERSCGDVSRRRKL